MKVDLTLIKRINDSISKGSTGCPDCFAEKLGVSKRYFHEVREFMITELAAPITYSRSRQTYYYAEEWEFYIGDLKSIREELIKSILDAINKTLKIILLMGVVFF